MTRQHNRLVIALFCMLVVFVPSVYSQGSTPSGTPVVISDSPSYDFWSKLFFVAGGATYICQARSYNITTTITQSAISNASPAVVTATAHGIPPSANPTVTITGGTGNWAAFNGTHVVTYVNANSFSVPVNTSGFGAVTGTIVIRTNAPRTNQPMWSVSRVLVDAGTGDPISSFWAVGGYTNVCDNRASLSYQ